LVEGVDEGNKMDLLCLLMKLIWLDMKPSMISRYHPETKWGVGVQLINISHRRYPTYENYMVILICAQISINLSS
jgi:uncharacterized protein YijF (DUF1287 family)